MKHFLFADDKTGDFFIVRDFSESRAFEVACIVAYKPRYIRLLTEFETKTSELCKY